MLTQQKRMRVRARTHILRRQSVGVLLLQAAPIAQLKDFDRVVSIQRCLAVGSRPTLHTETHHCYDLINSYFFGVGKRMTFVFFVFWATSSYCNRRVRLLESFPTMYRSS